MTLGQYLREYLASVFTISGAELIPPGVSEPTTFPAMQVDLNYKVRLEEESQDGGDTVRTIQQHYSARAWVEVAPDTAGAGTLDAAMDDLEEEMTLAVDMNSDGGIYQGDGFHAELVSNVWQNVWRAPDDSTGKGSITIDGILTYYYVVE